MSRRLLSTVQVSDEIGVPVTTLRYWRSRNEGPRSFKVGRGVRYREGDVDEWLNEQMEVTGRGDVVSA